MAGATAVAIAVLGAVVVTRAIVKRELVAVQLGVAFPVVHEVVDDVDRVASAAAVVIAVLGALGHVATVLWAGVFVFICGTDAVTTTLVATWAACPKSISKADGLDHADLSAVHFGLIDLEEVVVPFRIHRALIRRAGADDPRPDGWLPLPETLIEIDRVAVDAVHVVIGCGVEAVPAPVVKAALDVRCLFGPVVIHVDLDNDLGPAAHLRLTAAPPFVGCLAGLSIEATFTVAWTSVGV